ncbi:MurR/RpiR family transcriptional regulator [Lactobacillus sp. ESL0684]|uniref:MurR/RpiR family transcriptional regulator n=1 Tax=unclassified Lactobacillus TaxID=2620435 RepID=UPI0023F90A6F|nr:MULTISPECIES: MurR/RpiR family transcriptional regulator [unclassified Lactobacillus]WEV39537.1 MurR/RpiR family transcriptional regulator [Lactobacillus sp. ESL0681]WEV43947.1 MurR/RpiR family transcriptional regulator [Lactobacillus sp. ESL0684]
MNFENRVEATRRNLTTSEEKIADYILGHPETAVKMSISELAQASKTSAATVSRLVKSLQIDSYTAMKVMISVDLANQTDADADEKLDVTADESFTSICNKLISNEIENINQTKNLLQEDICNAVVDRLLKTKTIYVFGVGASALSAKNIYQKWTRIGYNVVWEEDINVLLAQLSSAKATDTLWLISNSGETPECLYLASYAQEQHIFTITLTMFGSNSLFKLADLALTTSKPIEPDVRVGATNSLTGQFYLIDVIFYLYFSRNYKKSLKAITASRQVVQDYRKSFKFKK